MASSLSLDDVSVVSAAGQSIVRDVTLRVHGGESIAVIGRSGAGKTTLLRLINGLAKPSSGIVSIDDVPVMGDLAARRRSIGTILQAPALFPHRTVLENLATVPRLLSWDEERTRGTARELLEQLGMPFDKFASRFPRSLSGGEQQRVAIARAMITRPPLLLCDEPFSALDPLVRRELQDAFVMLRDRGDVTMMFVTHDLAEAVRVGERLVLMENGAIVCDLPRGEFLASRIPLVRRFIEAAQLPEARS
jgi:osmoprotectant transport system ATP-binding protein